MCFILTKNQPEKAKEDIHCWKLLNANCSPAYGGDDLTKFTHRNTIPYISGKKNPKIKLIVYNGEIEEGYHSYRTKDRAIYWKGLHADDAALVKEFVIPKGTLYCGNMYELVSETIIMI